MKKKKERKNFEVTPLIDKNIGSKVGENTCNEIISWQNIKYKLAIRIKEESKILNASKTKATNAIGTKFNWVSWIEQGLKKKYPIRAFLELSQL